MFRSLLVATALTLPVTALPTLALAQESVHVRGTVEAVDGDRVTVSATGGETVDIVMIPDYTLVLYEPISVDDLAPGDFLSIPSIPGADGGKVALSINVFPEAMRGSGEGERPWDTGEGSLMTNATIGTVESAAAGNIVMVTYGDSSEPITVPEGTPITRFAPEPDRRLEAGDKAIVFATTGDDGTLGGGFAGISADGSIPPV